MVKEEPESFGQNVFIPIHLCNPRKLNRHPAAHPAPTLRWCSACLTLHLPLTHSAVAPLLAPLTLKPAAEADRPSDPTAIWLTLNSSSETPRPGPAPQGQRCRGHGAALHHPRLPAPKGSHPATSAPRALARYAFIHHNMRGILTWF